MKLLNISLLVLSACREDPKLLDAQPHSWEDAYRVWADGSCDHMRTCHPDAFDAAYLGDKEVCILQTLTWDCFWADCKASFPSERWSLMLQCHSEFETLDCSIEWPQICIDALKS
jgi:hypothetical protein